MAMSGMPKRGRARRQRRSMAEINVTPFVDVMLVLLIVFMVTAPLLTTGVAVELPRAASEALPGQDEPISITVDAGGTIHIQDTVITLEQLATRLAAVSNENREARIFVRGDRSADYGNVLAAIGAIQAAGFANVSLVTENPVNAAASG